MTGFQLNKSQRRKLSVFLKCVLFSFIAWVLFAISSKYIYTKRVALTYIQYPENKAFSALQVDSAWVNIEATGWQLLFSSIGREERSIQVDLSGLRNRSYITFANQIGFINRQFPANQRVLQVSPDTLYFDFSIQNEKRVPIRVQHELTFSKKFGLIGPARTTPAYATIKGPREELSKIDFWLTDTVKGRNLNHPVHQLISLNRNEHPNLRVMPDQVEVSIPVGEMTEKILSIPIEVLNMSGYRSVKLLPKHVQLTVLVSLVDFAALNPDQFHAVVDMNDWEEGPRTTLPVKILKKPAYTSIIRIHPQNLDFFVNK
jgi:hypothetical protein